MTTTQADLDRSGRRIETMWREGAPRRVAVMEAEGTFYDFILDLQTQEERLFCNLIESGMRYDQVMEMIIAASAPPLSEDEDS